MPSLKDFVAALQAGWFPALAALVGCSIIIAGDYFQVPYLDVTPSYLITTAVVIGVFSFGILVANIVYLPVLGWRRIQLYRDGVRRRDNLIQRVKDAPQPEINMLGYLVSSNRRAFQTYTRHPVIGPMIAKELIHPLGTGSALQLDYIVNESVWEYLVANRDLYFMDLSEVPGDPLSWEDAYLFPKNYNRW